MRHASIVVALLGGAAFAGAAIAQDASGQGSSAARGVPLVTVDAAPKVVDASIANGPNDSLLKAGALPDLQVVFNDKEKVASLSWGWTVSGPVEGERFGFTDFTLKLSTSFDENDEAKELLGLRGFNGGTSVALNFTHFWGRRIPVTPAMDAEDTRALDRAIENCNAAFFGASDKSRTDRCTENGAEFPGVSAFLEKYNPAEFKAAMARHLAPAYPFVGVEFAGNRQQFNYLDSTAFAQKKVEKFGFSVAVQGGLLFTRMPASVGVSFTYAKKYDAEKSITLCQPINAIPQSQCLTGANGLPGLTESAVVSAELRRAFSLKPGAAPSIAIVVEGSVDLKNDAYSVDAPIYFVGDGSDKLRGGIRLGYLNEKNDGGGRKRAFTAAVFVGVPFKL